MSLNKNIKYPQADYHQWNSTEISNGDIIGVYESLPNRAARSVKLENTGPSIVQLNVSQKIFKNQEYDNSWIQDASYFIKPQLVDEIEVPKDDILLESGIVQFWTFDEVVVNDIKIVSSSGLRITIT